MRGNSDTLRRMRALRRLLFAGGAFIAVLSLGGCSTGNLTGFDFPAFGLTKKADEPSADPYGSPTDQRLGYQ